ncbi:NAD-dependent epimerase/dehydratase family protein [Mesonia mobilis]|uniref:ATP-grasp domain-containing protein n=1 Tax=Mesonia mobilis TaxID=369791 RepID=A0ABQ3BPG7_9FLAO|nr:NAD-dependent epimerase/dehydratase family protein [Mesonia mobilis]GGZ53430.1 hypothetical protein GCM10008088_13890 [Mesonia mobilis]
MKSIRVGISSIGSGVGQSVINSCRLSSLPLYTVGFGTNPMAYGLYECDTYAYTKSFYDKGYIEDVIAKCKEYEIDIFFPGHDDDAHIISKHLGLFKENNIAVPVSRQSLIDLCRDKELMSNELNKMANIFVRSYDKTSFLAAYAQKEIALPVIAKPRDGYASKGIAIILKEDDFDHINEIHIVQELAVPHQDDPLRAQFDKQLKQHINPQISEISIQLVADREGEIVGKMISYNKLNNGVPIEIIPYENKAVWEAITPLYPVFKKLGLRGPFNLQGRFTDQGLKLFEMNARFTGITGLRAYMGFNEVEYCIKEWLGLPMQNDPLVLNYNHFGIRQTADKSISLTKNPEVKKFYDQINKICIKPQQNILVTGATGYLGRNLITKLLKDYPRTYSIWGYVRDKAVALNYFDPSLVKLFDYQDFKKGVLSLGNVDVLLHAGFTRPHGTDKEIAESLSFTQELFTKAIQNQVAKIINISSQSVYSTQTGTPHLESELVSPESSYAIAKYASELLLKSLANTQPHINYTSIRLSSISGGLAGFNERDLLSKLVTQAQNAEVLKVYDGQQDVVRLDIRDAIDALVQVIQSSDTFEPVYNLGNEKVYTLSEVVDQVIEVSTSYTTNLSPKEHVEAQVSAKFGMNSALFQETFSWKSRYALSETIASIFEYKK